MSKRVHSEVEASINVDQLRRKIEQENRQPGGGLEFKPLNKRVCPSISPFDWRVKPETRTGKE
jgi:hypothetical protein